MMNSSLSGGWQDNAVAGRVFRQDYINRQRAVLF
jgi:hypothetical protein